MNLAEKNSDDFPLASVQEVVWLDQLIHPDIPFYNIGMALRINGYVDPSVLEATINLLIEKNDSLRLVFSEDVNGHGAQQASAFSPANLRVVDFSNHTSPENAALVYLREQYVKPFSLTGGHLWNYQLVRVGPAVYYWLQGYHHLVMDGYGALKIAHLGAKMYNALVGDNKTSCIGPAPSYFDFVAEDRLYLDSPRFERDKKFWQDRCADYPPSFVRPNIPSAAGSISGSGQVRWTIERGHYTFLDTFARGCGLTISYLLISVISTYFALTNNADKVVVGFPVHNRTSARYKSTLGMFSSVIPLIVDIDRRRPILHLMESVAAELRRCYRHQRFPISEINRDLKLSQSGRKQLFDLTLSLESTDGDICFNGALSEIIAMDNGYEQTPLAIFVRDYHSQDDVVVDFNFNSSAFDKPAVQAIQARIARLLDLVATHAATPVCDLPLLCELERHQLLTSFNDTAAGYPASSTIHQLFEQQVTSTPESVAVLFAGRELTYRELNERANQLAHYLTGRGVGPDTLVGICVERSLDMIVGLLGILKAGGAYVPLDPGYPPERLAYMLADAKPTLTLTQSHLRGGVWMRGAPVWCLDSQWQDVQPHPPSNPVCRASSANLAYVIYTSGSTGKPKGTLLTHQGLCNLVSAQPIASLIKPGERLLQFASFNFDASTWEIFMTIANGATLCMAPRSSLMPGAELENTLRQLGVTAALLPPIVLSTLSTTALPSLKTLIVGGEACPQALVAQWATERHFVNAYGPTEATVYATVHPCEAGRAGNPPIGRPIANTRVYLLDASFNPVPVGATGELYIAGVGLARGYLNRADLSAERFVPDPFSAEPGARMYQSGDLARYLPAGEIEFQGRTDDQVKLRGFRLELGEIEAALAACPGVRDAAVLAREDTPGDKRLTAYVTAHDGGVENVMELRRSLLKTLPDYMVPSAFLLLDALPLTPNGKVDRKALPAPSAAAAQVAYSAPRNSIEQTLASVWAEVLKLERVGIHDNFFESGGNSMLVVMLHRRLSTHFPDRLAVTDLFTYSTIGKLSLFLSQVAVPDASPPDRSPRVDNRNNRSALMQKRIDSRKFQQSVSATPMTAYDSSEQDL